MKTECLNVCGDSKEKTSRGWIPPAEIGLSCKKKAIHYKKEACGFHSFDKIHSKKMYLYSVGD